MEIKVRSVSKWLDVSIIEGGTTLALGLHDAAERKSLAKVFLNAAEELLNGLSDDPGDKK